MHFNFSNLLPTHSRIAWHWRLANFSFPSSEGSPKWPMESWSWLEHLGRLHRGWKQTRILPDTACYSRNITKCGRTISSGLFFVWHCHGPINHDTLSEYRFLKEYHTEGVDFWGISPQNRPSQGFMESGDNSPCMGWSSRAMSKFVGQYLGPTLSSSDYDNLMIITVDDYRYLVPWSLYAVSDMSWWYCIGYRSACIHVAMIWSLILTDVQDVWEQ